ncbi:hypothetical protein GSH19_04465 [Lactobacillus sp. S2-2]|uniref:hypothetical protein n=1 Tax=Lactobacillus sp. S2-2 TaxID=2692917 RepID=UPI001F31C505|nr:hypothetical protein [Lactobacillus sp. S2-2]MCF6515407.1 hypothetical protein [Lactobacillus sp. S2-2]
MKKNNFISVLISLSIISLIFISGCGKTQNNHKNQNASFKNDIDSTSSIKSNLTKNNNLWYVKGKLNSKSKSGFETYEFKKDGKANVYNVSKIYKTKNDAKNNHDLNKNGTLTYKIKNNNGKTSISFKGKMAGIPMTQSFKLKDTIDNKTELPSKTKVFGYKINHDIDGDSMNRILIQPK